MPDSGQPPVFVKATKFVPLLALRSVTSQDGWGVYASSDTLYKGAVFGRDSLEVCDDLLTSRSALVRRILLALARLQGETVNPVNEEAPGKIIHEYRRRVVDGKPIKGRQLEIFKTLSAKWGGNSEEMRYYGSVDATPQFIRVLGAYCQQYPDQANTLLAHKVTLQSGTIVTVYKVAERAMEWLLDHLQQSRSGLMEYQRQNPHGIENQVWKDSAEFYVHENGKLANHKAPIASIEVQGQAYDALWYAAQLFPAQRKRYLAVAAALRQKTCDLLWQPERQYFALGTDFDEKGDLRIIQTTTANPAALLDTRFFDDLDLGIRETYVSMLVKHIMSSDFLTDAGIRSRALSERHLIPFEDYHGSFVTWPKETYDIAKGLRRQGFSRLAEELENRLLNVCLRNLAYPEFIYVDERGRVLPARPTAHSHGDAIIIDGPNKPEVIQAWTVSAIVAITSRRTKAKTDPLTLAKRMVKRAKTTIGREARPIATNAWQAALEQQILASIPRVSRLINPSALRARYPRYDFQIKP